MLKLLRVIEGVMKEKLEIPKKEWRKHWVKYGPLRYVRSRDGEEEEQQQSGEEMEIAIGLASEKYEFSDKVDVKPQKIELEVVQGESMSMRKGK